MGNQVSIITPCYNGETYVNKYLDSILNQTYKNIELIFINDGSTDKTEHIVFEYKAKFKEKGIDFIYIYQENAGQAAAINQGLRIFKGDFLTWPDSDDVLTEDSIEKKMHFLLENKQYGLVRSDAKKVKESDMSNIIGYFAKGNPNKYKDELFLDCIIENNFWFAPGCYMVRSSNFFEVMPERRIYPSRAGQNWQMLLPIMYKFKCGFIDEPLYTYVIRENSHSHSIKNLYSKLKRFNEHEDILIHTIDTMQLNNKERKEYKKIVEEKYIRKRLQIAFQLNEWELIEKEYKFLSNNYSINKNEMIFFYLHKYKLYNLLKKMRHFLSKS